VFIHTEFVQTFLSFKLEKVCWKANQRLDHGHHVTDTV